MFWEIIFMALVGGVIGWFTNYLAIKLIFRPLYPIKIPLIGIKLQGLVPKRREEIATSIGKTVEEQLLSLDDIMGYLNTDENQDIIIKNIRIGILKIISEKIPAFIPHGIKNTILKYTGDIVEKESKDYIEKNMDNLISQAVKTIDVKQLVEEKINNFDLAELETIILSLSSRELRYIEVLGGGLGFLIGLIQGLLIKLIS